MWFDVHTHRLSGSPSDAILSCTMHDAPVPAEAVFLSVGIHPWHLSSDDILLQMRWMEAMLESDKRVVAIGEAGLDKRCATPFPLQEQAFHFACLLSARHGLPLVIHAVRSANEIIALKKEIHPDKAWIIHGFRGKKELALALVKQGFILSFGEHYHPEALASLPAGTFLIETDESPVSAETLYLRAAQVRGVSPDLLEETVRHTVNSLFFNR